MKEFIFAVIKGHEVEEGYLVTGMLVPLIVPVDLPLWMLAVAVIFGVVIGKEAWIIFQGRDPNQSGGWGREKAWLVRI